MSEEIKIKLPKEQKRAEIITVLTEDEDWSFNRVKLNRDKPRIEVANPSKEDPDNVDMVKVIQGVCLLAKKNFYQSQEDKEAGKAPTEKRSLYLVRSDKRLPELMFISPSGLRNWGKFCSEVAKQDLRVNEVLIEIGAEGAANKAKGFKWSKPTFRVIRELEQDEKDWVNQLTEAVEERAAQYDEYNEDYSQAEEQAAGIKSDKPPVVKDNDDDDPPVTTKNKDKTKAKKEKASERKFPKIDDDDEEEITSVVPNLDDDDD